MIDTHLHSSFSTDSKMNIEEAMETAKEKGIGLTITDHMDLNYFDKSKFRFSVDEYMNKYSPLRSESFFIGIELGMGNDVLKENKYMVESYDFDQVIGSVHMLGNDDIYMSSTYENKSKKDIFTKYLLTMIECVKSHHFVDILAHIDYMCRYCPYEDKEIYYEEFKDLIDQVLKEIIKNNIVMEINTRRLDNKNAFNNLTKIYKRYENLGGKYVTIGSDAHLKDDIGKNFKQGKEIAKMCNLKPVYFKNREMEYI